MRAGKMTRWLEALTMEAWRPGFNPWNPRKGRREPTAQICPLTSTQAL